MRCFLGVDLGSTMSKAVLLDERERILGAGASSTRGRHVDSITHARTAAENDARLRLFERKLCDAGCSGPAAARARAAVERELARCRTRHVMDLVLARVEDAATREALQALARDLVLAADLRSAREQIGAATERAKELAARCGLTFDALSTQLEAIAFADEEEPPTSVDRDTLPRMAESACDVQSAPEVATAIAVLAARQATGEPLEILSRTGTGYGRHTLPFHPDEMRSEILCHGLGAHYLFPGTRTVLDIGGQDTKAIHVDETGVVLSFQMNDRCAAGCGRFLGYVADELGLTLDEMAALACRTSRPAGVSSTCTVFAGAEARELLAAGVPLDEVLAGLHEAVAERALGLLARSGEIRGPVTFTGGVAKNPAVVAAVRRLLRDHLGAPELNVAPQTIFAGALGAALFAHRRTERHT